MGKTRILSGPHEAWTNSLIPKDLSMHDWNEPMQRALDISEERGVTLVSPEIGQRLAIAEPQPAKAWWQ